MILSKLKFFLPSGFGLTILRIKNLYLDLPKEVSRIVNWGILAGLISAFVEFLFSLLIQLFLYNVGLINNKVPSNMFGHEISLTSVVVLMLVCSLARSVLVGLRIFLPRVACQKYNELTRGDMVHTALLDAGSGSLYKTISIFSDDVSRAGNCVLSLVSIFTLLATVSILSFLGFKTSFEEMLTGSIAAIAAFFFLKYLKKALNINVTDISKEWSKIGKILTDGLRNNFFLRIYNLEEHEVNRSKSLLNRYYNIYRKYIFSVGLEAAIPSFIAMFVIVIITITSIELGNHDPAALLAFFYIFLRFVQSASDLMVSVSDFNFNYNGINVISQWKKQSLLEGVKRSPKFERNNNLVNIHEICMKNVYFKYPDGAKDTIRNLSFKIQTGECLVILGNSGSGKSTLLSILLGILTPNKGDVLYNGLDVGQYKEKFSDNLGYVGPAPYIVEGSLRENLLYPNQGNALFSDSEIFEALEVSQIKDLVENLPNGLDFKLNDTASVFSTGQKQRLMIARALLKKPSIMILDEATSNLDESVEQKIIDELSRINKNSILIIVTHRPALKRLASQIIDLDQS